jgi:hypothetical protein
MRRERRQEEMGPSPMVDLALIAMSSWQCILLDLSFVANSLVIGTGGNTSIPKKAFIVQLTSLIL